MGEGLVLDVVPRAFQGRLLRARRVRGRVLLFSNVEIESGAVQSAQEGEEKKGGVPKTGRASEERGMGTGDGDGKGKKGEA